MLAELCNFLLISALSVNIFQILTYTFKIKSGNLPYLCFLHTFCLCITYIGLIFCFINNDFTVLYVANNSNSSLPLFYKIAAAWSAHEGSLLLWCLMLSCWTSLIAVNKQKIAEHFLNKTILVLCVINMAFLLFTIVTSNPFARIISEMVIDGNDLNPLLQDLALILHPPILYIGYTGCAIPFAVVMAGLMDTAASSHQVSWSIYLKPWLLLPWMFLTIGITLGSWWAYYELGWGGWWAWDPVENVSFMPWLVGVATLHLNLICIKQKKLYSVCILFCIINFCLSLIGGFLVRSGILSSIHSFASHPVRGIYMLIFIFFVIGAALLLYAKKSHNFIAKTQFYFTSRESFLLLNASILMVTALAILFGTLYPLFYEVLTQNKISVGPPYFNRIFIILSIPILLLITPGSYSLWKSKINYYKLKKVLLYLLSSIVFSYVFLSINFSKINWYCMFFLSLALIIILSMLPFISTIKKIPMLLGHIGVGVMVIGIAVVSCYEQENDLRLTIGESVAINKYKITFLGEKLVEGANYIAQQGIFEIRYQDTIINTLLPEKRIYIVSDTAMAETAIDANIFRDLYITMAQHFADGSWACRIYYKPGIRWIWLGLILMAAGGLGAVVLSKKGNYALS